MIELRREIIDIHQHNAGITNYYSSQTCVARLTSAATGYQENVSLELGRQFKVEIPIN
jgi:hypothetical protein